MKLGRLGSGELVAAAGSPLLAAALAPPIPIWIVVREHELSWRRGGKPRGML